MFGSLLADQFPRPPGIYRIGADPKGEVSQARGGRAEPKGKMSGSCLAPFVSAARSGARVGSHCRAILYPNQLQS